jgi:type VI secretion system protein VasG
VRVDPKSLVKRLDPLCRRALEGGVALAVARAHYEVTVEHVLRKLLDEPGSDVAAVLRHYDVHPPRLIAALDRVLEPMSTGNTGRPVFSPLLFAWLEDAFLFGAAELGGGAVRSGHLLVALLARPGRTGIDEHTDELAKIPPDDLRRELATITAGTSEDEAPAGAPAHLPAGAHGPGEEALARFTLDLTARATAGDIDPVLARDHEIRQLVDVLTRRRKNNPILIGEAGVGKTAVVEGFALRVAQSDVPEPLRGVRVLTLDLGLLQAGAGVKGEFESRLKQIIHDVKTARVPTILFIDEAHTLIGAGGSPGGSDAAQLLKPALARGEVRVIAATTFSEYKKYIEKDPALERRFQPITVAEPSVADAIVMLRGVKAKFEKHHRVRVLDEAVEAAVRLSDRYISGRLLPDKAVDLIDTACARVAVGQSAKPGRLDDLERRIASLTTAIEAMERDRDEALVERPELLAKLESERTALQAERDALAATWATQRDAVSKARTLQEAPDRAPLRDAMASLSALHAEGALVHLHVDAAVVAQIVSDWTGIPVGNVVKDEVTRLLALEKDLERRVVGQREAIEALARRIRAAKASLAPPQQPIGVFLLVGPSGVGKTETGLALAELLFGGERFVVSVNMSEFMEKHTVSRLIGSPPGYVGYGEGGVLTEAVRHRPYSVVLLDEVEKAHPDVMNLFHQVFDKGVLADGEGRVVDFKNTVIVMTSNLGTEVIERTCAREDAPSLRALVEAVRPTLMERFKPALLGRMTVVPYVPLSPDVLRTIVQMKLDRIAARLAAEHGVTLEVTDAARDAILARCDDPSSGARNIDHVLDDAVLPQLSEELLGYLADGSAPDRVTLDADERRALTFRFERTPVKRPAEPPPLVPAPAEPALVDAPPAKPKRKRASKPKRVASPEPTRVLPVPIAAEPAVAPEPRRRPRRRKPTADPPPP